MSLNYDGPLTIYYLLKLYTGEAIPVIRHCQNRFNNLNLKDTNYDIEVFTDKAQTLIQKMVNSGGNDSQLGQKLFEALICSPVNEFNADLHAWKSVLDMDNRTINPYKLLNKAKVTYMNLSLQNKWIVPHQASTQNSHHHHSNHTNSYKQDIAALTVQVHKLEDNLGHARNK